MRAIAVSLIGGSFLFKFYFDRKPTDDDIEVASVVGSNFGAFLAFDKSVISEIQEECLYSSDSLDDLSMRDDLVFARKEQL